MARRYIPLSDEIIMQAQHADIVSFLKQRGEKVYKEGKCFVWEKHDSVRIEGYMWYQNSTQQKGAAVAFAMHFFKLHFLDAVAELTGKEIPTLPQREEVKKASDGEDNQNKKAEKTTENKEFCLPEKAKDSRHVYAYLNRTRMIDHDVIETFFERGSLYEDVNKNAVFIGFDDKGKARSAHKKGTNTNVPYKRCVYGSNLNFPFAYIEKSADKLYVFEAAIDMMSFMCMNKNMDVWNQDLIAIGGLHINPVYNFLEMNPNIKKVIFCTDNDTDGKLPDGTPRNHGQEFAKKHMINLRTMDYETEIFTPAAKDWNQDLINWRKTK